MCKGVSLLILSKNMAKVQGFHEEVLFNFNGRLCNMPNSMNFPHFI